MDEQRTKDMGKVQNLIRVWCKEWVRDFKPDIYAQMEAAAYQQLGIEKRAAKPPRLWDDAQ